MTDRARALAALERIRTDPMDEAETDEWVGLFIDGLNEARAWAEADDPFALGWADEHIRRHTGRPSSMDRP